MKIEKSRLQHWIANDVIVNRANMSGNCNSSKSGNASEIRKHDSARKVIAMPIGQYQASAAPIGKTSMTVATERLPLTKYAPIIAAKYADTSMMSRLTGRSNGLAVPIMESNVR